MALTTGAIALAIVCIGLVIALPRAVDALGLGAGLKTLMIVGRWPLLAGVIATGLGIVYRVAPPRDDPKWRWVTPGAAIETALWIAGSLAFSYYTANFGSYNETYGSVAAVAIMLMWFFMSAFVVLLGAEINAEAEKQTACPGRSLELRCLSGERAESGVGLCPHCVQIAPIKPRRAVSGWLTAWFRS